MNKKININNKIKVIAVITFIIIYAITTYISLRGQYLEYTELGTQYVNIFFTNIKYKYSIMVITFLILSTIIYFTNRGIKKGLKPFFEQDKKEMPKLPNKSITLIVAAIASVIISNTLLEKILLCASNVSFQQADIIFNLDISYYMFIKPLIEEILKYFIILVIGLSIYVAGYYILVFNIFFEAVDRKLLRESKLIKTLLRNVILLAIGISLSTILSVQDILTGKFLTLNNGIELTGAGFVEAKIQLFGYIGFAIVIIVAAISAVRQFAKHKNKKIMFTLLTVPSYLVILFVIMVATDFIFVKPNEFDKEKNYILSNIQSTKKAYGIEVEESNIEYSGTIEEDEVEENSKVIDNIALINKNVVKQSLEDTQTDSGYYTFRNVNLAKYNIDGKEQLVYVAPREIANQSISYNNKTYEYTHGMGQIVASATSTSSNGNVQYIQKSISGRDNINEITEPRIYYGLETNSTIVTNTKNKEEYDYTDEDGIEHTYSYNGKSGIQVGFLDRLILALTKGDIKLAMSNAVTDDSKILVNRNIIERAKTALPYLIYDDEPYTVIENEQIYWVLDAYTISNQYPYSTYTTIINDGERKEINYIRNSAKVIINAYDGEMKFYITDKNDPIIMAYLKLYPTIFTTETISNEIQEQIKYPEFLYKIQAEKLMVYHNVKADVLYRNSDIWSFVTYGTSTTNSKNKTSTLQPYYTMLKTPDNEEAIFGLVQMYTQTGKSNITSYLVGTSNGVENKLKIYKYPTDSNIVGPINLDNQIEQDETISAELADISGQGVKISKEMKIIPINNTVLYVETIYQTRTNEINQPTTLQKVIVASGTKVAIGDDLRKAIANLLSQSAVNIEITNTEDIEGLIEAIINANKNLTESNERNDWEMMGTDLKELQKLINMLDQKKKEELEAKEKIQIDNLE